MCPFLSCFYVCSTTVLIGCYVCLPPDRIVDVCNDVYNLLVFPDEILCTELTFSQCS